MNILNKINDLTFLHFPLLQMHVVIATLKTHKYKSSQPLCRSYHDIITTIVLIVLIIVTPFALLLHYIRVSNNVRNRHRISMSLNFFTRFFNKRTGSGENETPPEPKPVPIRRLSSSKSGKLRIKKVKSSQNIKDIHFYAKPEDGDVPIKVEKVNNNTEQEENISVDEVIKEMYDVVQSGGVK